MSGSSMAAQMVGRRVLITVEGWFFAPDGRQYKAIAGRLRGLHSAPQVLGFKPNARSVDWYAEVGRAVVAGCQINYAVGLLDEEPNFGPATDFSCGQDGVYREYERQSLIFDAGD